MISMEMFVCLFPTNFIVLGHMHIAADPGRGSIPFPTVEKNRRLEGL